MKLGVRDEVSVSVAENDMIDGDTTVGEISSLDELPRGNSIGVLGPRTLLGEGITVNEGRDVLSLSVGSTIDMDDTEGENDVWTTVVNAGIVGSGVGDKSVPLKSNIDAEVAIELGKTEGVVKGVVVNSIISLADAAS